MPVSSSTRTANPQQPDFLEGLLLAATTSTLNWENNEKSMSRQASGVHTEVASDGKGNFKGSRDIAVHPSSQQEVGSRQAPIGGPALEEILQNLKYLQNSLQFLQNNYKLCYYYYLFLNWFILFFLGKMSRNFCKCLEGPAHRMTPTASMNWSRKLARTTGHGLEGRVPLPEYGAVVMPRAWACAWPAI